MKKSFDIIKLALPYYSQYKKLQNNELNTFFDVIELKNFEDLQTYKGSKEAILHLGLGIVNSIWQTFFDNNKNIALLNKINYLSLDFGPSCLKTGFIKDKGLTQESPLLSKSEIIKASETNLFTIKKYFKGTIALENLDYNSTGAYEFVTDPKFIANFINKHSLNLLLDIAHAQVSAFVHNMDVYEYMDQLPLTKIYEIHMSSPVKRKLILKDGHKLPSLNSYKILAWVLKKMYPKRPKYIAIEYSEDYSRLSKEYINLKKGIS